MLHLDVHLTQLVDQWGMWVYAAIAATIFAFTVSWAAFVYPTAFVTTPDQMPLTIGVVSQLVRADTFAWGQIMAGALVAALPPVVIYAFLMDYYIAGLTAGATKG